MQKYPLIIGLGKTGISCAHYFARNAMPFRLMDTRLQPHGLTDFSKDFPNIQLHLGSFNEKWLYHASEIILSPGISPDEPAIIKAKQKGIPVIGDIELFAREAQAPIVAITGTNAKGTVTTLIGEMINDAGYKVCVGGNIGIPALELLLSETPDFYVLEISSFQLETTHRLPALAATILNMSPDHLDRHGTMENYHAAKQRIYRDCENAIYYRQDHLSMPITHVKNCISFGLDKPDSQQFGILDQQLSFGDKPLLKTTELRIKGKHNWLNALAALALGKAIGLPFPSMRETLLKFPGLEHRCEWVATHHNIAWYNDSKGTNIGATIAALDGLGPTLSGKIILIAGGVGKDADFSLLQSAVSKYVRQLILFGRDATLIANALQNHTQIAFAESLAQTVVLATQFAQPGDAVLLSPACASLDMFRDFEDRGRQFKMLVKDYVNHDSNYAAH